MKFGVINSSENLVVFFGHRGGSHGDVIWLRDVIDDGINVNFDFVVIVSPAPIYVETGVKVTMSVGGGRRRPSGGG